MVITIEDVRLAARRIAAVCPPTPMLNRPDLVWGTHASLAVKIETLQPTGSFKMRGAYNALTARHEAGVRTVVTYSSGNYGAAAAFAARRLGMRAVVMLPSDCPEAKRQAVLRQSAELVHYDRYRDDRARVAVELARRIGGEVIHPDDPLVLAGHATVALELTEAIGDLDVLVVPVGSGGLAAGCAVVLEALRPRASVVGVEPEASPDLQRSLQAGTLLAVPPGQTIADGLQLRSVTPGVWPILRRRIREVVTVSDADLVDALRFCAEQLRVWVEPSGAAGLAALLCGAVDATGLRVATVLTGANVGIGQFLDAMGPAPAARAAGAA